MNNTQLYFAIGVPTFTILVGIVIGLSQSNHVVNLLGARFTSLEANLTGRLNLLEGDLKTVVRVTNDLDVRLARLEERSARS